MGSVIFSYIVCSGLHVLQETLLEEERREGRLDFLDVLKQKLGIFESLN